MGSFDGMDPTLVRDLLAEVRRAAVQMRSLESRVAQATRSAGLATPATHRPSQVADACEEMARDVTGRLALLEKKEAAPRVGEQAKDISPNGTPASGETRDPAPKDSKEPREDDRASRTANPRETTPPNDPPPSSDPAPRKDPTPPEPESKKDPAPAEPESKRDPAPAEAESKKDPEPAPKSESTPRDAPAEPAPKTGETPEPRPAPHPDSRAEDVTSATDQPKDGDRDSRHDRGTEPGTPGQDILDTPAKDHPDDIDQSDAGKPQVVEVDGVKVLQIPLDPPTAREIADLLDDVEAIRPTDLPSVEGSAAPLAPAVQPPVDTPLAPAVQPSSNGPSAPLTPAVQPPVDTAVAPAVQPPSHGPSAPLTPAVQPPVDAPLTPAVQPQEGTSGVTTGATASGGWANDGSEVVSVDARPPSDAALRSLVDNASDIEPMEMPSVEVPPGEWGEGRWVPKDFGPDGAAGSVDPGGAASQASGGGDPTSARGAVYEGPAAGQQSEPTSSAGSASPPEPTRAGDTTDVSASSAASGGLASPPESTRGSDTTGEKASSAASGGERPGERSEVRASDGGATGGDGSRERSDAVGLANDGSDVVSVDARPPSDAALRSLVDNASDIEPMEMPSVEVPPGEWGKGEWVPKDFGPDGEPGRVEPGAPDRPTVPPGS
ncbi:hypothetical protein AB0G06_05900 [Nonomuraea dietziae]|uniref:hypothetical protein n=1 Tax=Nonomuraea dietziae TaxID=65515 RepID=UPI0033C9CB65